MRSFNALNRGTGCRRWCIDRGVDAMHLGAHLAGRVIDPMTRMPAWRPLPNRLRCHDGVALTLVEGDPATMGQMHAQSVGRQARRLLNLMALHPAVLAGRVTGAIDKTI